MPAARRSAVRITPSTAGRMLMRSWWRGRWGRDTGRAETVDNWGACGLVGETWLPAGDDVAYRKLGVELAEDAGRATEHAVQHQVLGRQDRKSTRLNSSHVEISYAVFCLKKKKKKLDSQKK